MFDGKFLKKALIGSAALIGGILLLPTSSLATSCTSTISGATLSGVVCDFDVGSSVTVSSGATLGGINQSSYSPSGGFILNGGTISNNGTIDDTIFGISISNSSLANGLTNNGSISATLDSGIFVAK